MHSLPLRTLRTTGRLIADHRDAVSKSVAYASLAYMAIVFTMAWGTHMFA